MKKLTSAAVLFLCLICACTKEPAGFSGVSLPVQPAGAAGPHRANLHAVARLSGDNYSRSIPVDTANLMLQSYLAGVGYPYVDTAIRSLSFDADTLRSYLQNEDIATVKFMFAHPAHYVNSGHNGVNSGFNPEALTLIVVGLNNDDQYVLNNYGGVYDHMFPCPSICPGNSDAVIE